MSISCRPLLPQTVQEVKNDFGLNARDRTAVMDRLKKQGLNATKVDVLGGVDLPPETNPKVRVETFTQSRMNICVRGCKANAGRFVAGACG